MQVDLNLLFKTIDPLLTSILVHDRRGKVLLEDDADNGMHDWIITPTIKLTMNIIDDEESDAEVYGLGSDEEEEEEELSDDDIVPANKDDSEEEEEGNCFLIVYHGEALI